jgi:hypothetical protein
MNTSRRRTELIVRALVMCGGLLAIAPAGAVYNANMSGVLATVATYADGDFIYITLQNQPTTHPSCNPAFFVIPETVPADRRKAMLARLMVAWTTGEAVNIGYDSTGSCAGGYIQVHRVG